tara:strand:+ start:2926 stop:3246 length:321 start_codon:yes stop_codon:yes gene_type:complete
MEKMPSSNITKISSEIVQIEHRLGFTIVKPLHDSGDVISLFCDICEFVLGSETDFIYYKKYKCCFSCGIKWADLNQDLWHEGWRPEKADIEKEIERRSHEPVSFSL